MPRFRLLPVKVRGCSSKGKTVTSFKAIHNLASILYIPSQIREERSNANANVIASSKVFVSLFIATSKERD